MQTEKRWGLKPEQPVRGRGTIQKSLITSLEHRLWSALTLAIQGIWTATAWSCFHCYYKTVHSISILCSQLLYDGFYYTVAIYHSSYSIAQYPAICLALKITAMCPVVSAMFASCNIITCLIHLRSVVDNSNCH